MRTYYDQNNHSLHVEIGSGDPVGNGAQVVDHAAVREYRDRNGDLVKYVVENVENNQQSIRDLAYAWMTARPAVGMEKNDLEALKLLKEWCTWLVAIETSIIAAIGIVQKEVYWSDAISEIARYLAAFTIVMLGVSIFVAIHMLLALPAMAQRLPPDAPPPNNDIYSLTNPVTHRPLGDYVWWVRWFSVLGFALFAALLVLAVIFKRPSSFDGV
jgi:hypothetical protein